MLGTVLMDASFLGLPALSMLRNIGGLVFSVGLAWLGYALWSERGETAAELVPSM